MKSLTVVIPSRSEKPLNTTLNSLQYQTFDDFITVVQPDNGRGSNWARNKGFEMCDTEFVLFSDDDIEWWVGAFDKMIDLLDANPDVSYCYGAYRMGRLIQCNVEFDEQFLKKQNYISTMSIMRSRHFPGFDEAIKRLQDWDLWLTMLEHGHRGIYCGEVIFDTQKREGITYGEDSITWEQAVDVVKSKHKLR